jgi:tRNA (guanine-N7-)-methyltransferase
MYKTILKKERYIYLKTDNRPLFEFSLNSFSDNGFKLHNITFDLHNSNFKKNIMTEYEKLFSEEGKPIYRVEALCL